MDLGHEKVRGADVVIPAVSRLDAENTGEFKSRLLEIEAGAGLLVLDLSRVEFVDSVGIGALLGLMRRQHERGSALRLCALTPPRVTIFTILKLHRVFEIFGSRAEALAG